MRNQEGISGRFRAAMFALPVVAAAGAASAQTASVTVVDGRTGLAYDQRVQCDDYMLLTNPQDGSREIFMTNDVAGQLDIASDIQLDQWDSDDPDIMETLAEIGGDIHTQAQGLLDQGYPEELVVWWSRTATARAIEERLLNHYMSAAHQLSEAEGIAAMTEAKQECESALGL